MKFDQGSTQTLKVSDFNDYVIDECITNIIKGTTMMFSNNVQGDNIHIILPQTLIEILKSNVSGVVYINKSKGYLNIWGFKVIAGEKDEVVILNASDVAAHQLQKIRYPIRKINWEDVSLADLPS